jgi:predicted acylesterase/phospholipase RssA
MVFNTLVLSGGANRGYCYIGVLKSLEDHNLNNFSTIMGTSIGSLFATFISMGFTAQEILQTINYKLKYDDIEIDDFFNTYGFYRGDEICENIKKVFKIKYNENITFKELYKKTRKKLIIPSLCLEDKQIEYFSYENHPNLKIIDAIRFSISIPFIFTLKEYNNKHYVDAAMIDNLSITYFNNPTNVLGIKLKTTEKKESKKDLSINKYIGMLYSCITAHSKKDLKKYKIVNINIDDDIITDPLDLKLEFSSIKKLINIGYQQTNLFIKKNN